MTVFRDRSIFIGGSGPVHLKILVWKKSVLSLKRKKILSYQCWGWKKLKFYDYFSRKKVWLCPITFCSGPNPPINIYRSLMHDVLVNPYDLIEVTSQSELISNWKQSPWRENQSVMTFQKDIKTLQEINVYQCLVYNTVVIRLWLLI